MSYVVNFLVWIIFIFNFIILVNVFGNFSINLYFEDNVNGISFFLIVKFVVMDFFCYNGGVCDCKELILEEK